MNITIMPCSHIHFLWEIVKEASSVATCSLVTRPIKIRLISEFPRIWRTRSTFVKLYRKLVYLLGIYSLIYFVSCEAVAYVLYCVVEKVYTLAWNLYDGHMAGLSCSWKHKNFCASNCTIILAYTGTGPNIPTIFVEVHETLFWPHCITEA